MTDTPKLDRLADVKKEFDFEVLKRDDKDARFKFIKRKKSQLDNAFSNVNVIDDIVLKRKYTISVNVSLAGVASRGKGNELNTDLNDDEEQALFELQKHITNYLKTIHEKL